MQIADVSIVIVNYNVKQLVINCLNSIQKYKGSIEIEVIVVDNASSDGSVEAIEQNFNWVKLIKNKINYGFPTANNQAFRLASGQHIFMLNPDTEFIDYSIEKLKHFLESNPEIDLVAPKLLNTNRTIQSSVWKFPKTRYIISEMFFLPFLGKDKYYHNLSDSNPTEVEYLTGAALLFKKDVFQKIGYLDEYLFWIEDADFCYRMHKAGLKKIYFPQAVVVHHIGQSAKKNYNISISNQTFNKIKFFKKHYSKRQAYLITGISFINVIVRGIAFLILSPINSVYYRKAKAYFYTIPKLFNPPAI